ncbi:hypothetical protein GB937_009818 [Aspergillus fischeri]|nr:hypothetical protein GB937_009818 [Aspergillus fischeri]
MKDKESEGHPVQNNTKKGIRRVEGSPDKAIAETIRDNILNHADDTTYDALFLTAGIDRYDYHVTCEDFATVCKDPAYISQCIIQAKFEDKHASTAIQSHSSSKRRPACIVLCEVEELKVLESISNEA